jgi:hypothetical protein
MQHPQRTVELSLPRDQSCVTSDQMSGQDNLNTKASVSQASMFMYRRFCGLIYPNSQTRYAQIWTLRQFAEAEVCIQRFRGTCK